MRAIYRASLRCRRVVEALEAGSMELRYGDRVFIKNLGVEGEVIEMDTRTIVVRYKKPDGEQIEHRFQPDDLEYRPKPHLE